MKLFPNYINLYQPLAGKCHMVSVCSAGKGQDAIHFWSIIYTSLDLIDISLRNRYPYGISSIMIQAHHIIMYWLFIEFHISPDLVCASKLFPVQNQNVNNRTRNPSGKRLDTIDILEIDNNTKLIYGKCLVLSYNHLKQYSFTKFEGRNP